MKNIPLIATHIDGLGSRTFQKAVTALGSAEALFHSSRTTLERLRLKPAIIEQLLNPPMARVEAALRWCEAPNHHYISLNDPNYPPLLKEMYAPPIGLFVLGNARLLTCTNLAMVGSRNPSPSGKETAFSFAKYLAKLGIAITSGMALGIDAASHEGALTAKGTTIAVLGCGVDHCYPKSHRKLYTRIAETGAIVSEFPLSTSPTARHFPQRNRIISALSQGVLVVEAAIKSGSLITARFAMEQGREVFAIPGSIHNPLARGCHHLIQQGAKLVETAHDIAEELGWSFKTNVTPENNDTSDGKPEKFANILCNIGTETTSIDTIVARSGLAFDHVCSMLLEMELNGLIQSVPGGVSKCVG